MYLYIHIDACTHIGNLSEIITYLSGPRLAFSDRVRKKF